MGKPPYDGDKTKCELCRDKPHCQNYVYDNVLHNNKCFVPMTNFERVKNMSIDELARWHVTGNECLICEQVRSDGVCAALLSTDKDISECCVAATKKWLESNATE